MNVLVTGIGGTGVITVGALLGMAAHLEGKGCLLLDVTGLAQKNGPVFSHIRIADDPDTLHATRIGPGCADLVLGCDIVVTAGAEAIPKMAVGRTLAVVNTHVAPTSAFASAPDLDLSSKSMEDKIRAGAGEEGSRFLAATQLATALMGDSIASNLFLMGYALQLGALPVSLPALERAIELNGRAVEMNKRALSWGRLAAIDLEAVKRAARPGLRASQTAPLAASLEEILAARVPKLVAYQNDAYARRYSELVERVKSRESEVVPGSTRLTEAVARYYFKLLAYKDEYEVMRMWGSQEFRAQLDAEFEGDFRIQLHIAPQLFFPRDPDTGRAKKIQLWSWALPFFLLISKFKFLRGTPFDIFAMTAHRKLERKLITDYEATVALLLDGLSPDNLSVAVDIASVPEHIRGFDLVKEEQLESAKAKEAELLEAFRQLTP